MHGCEVYVAEATFNENNTKIAWGKISVKNGKKVKMPEWIAQYSNKKNYKSHSILDLIIIILSIFLNTVLSQNVAIH